MATIKELENFQRKGRGKIFQFYITDTELQEVLHELNASKFGTFELITSFLDKEYNYQYDQYNISDFMKSRSEGNYIFFLRNMNVTPELDIPFENVDLSKYFMYNGLIRIWHGSKRNDNVEESSIMLVDSYYNLNDPKEVYKNEQYAKIFQLLKRMINARLKFRANHLGKDAKVYPVKSNNVSVEFRNQLLKGFIKAKLEMTS